MAEDATDPRLTEQALRKGEVEIRKLEAEAQTAALDSLTPMLPDQISRGTLDAGDSASPIGAVAAYRSLGACASSIVGSLPEGVTKVRIASSDVVTQERGIHESVSSLLDRVDGELQAAAQLLTAPRGIAPMAATAVAGLAGAAVQLIASLLKSNTTVRTQSLSISSTAVGAALAQEAIQKGLTVVLEGAPSAAGSTLMSQFRQLEGRRDELVRELATYRAEHVDEPSGDLAAATERRDAIRTLVNEQAKTKGIDDMKRAFDQLDAAAREASQQRRLLANHAYRVATVGEILDDATTVLATLAAINGSGQSLVAIADQYEANKDAHFVLVDPSYGGSESVYEEKVGRDRGLHVGSAVVAYVVVAPNGTVVNAGTVSSHLSATNKLGRTEITWGTISTST